LNATVDDVFIFIADLEPKVRDDSGTTGRLFGGAVLNAAVDDAFIFTADLGHRTPCDFGTTGGGLFGAFLNAAVDDSFDDAFVFWERRNDVGFIKLAGFDDFVELAKSMASEYSL
jgi:hypothetical protein